MYTKKNYIAIHLKEAGGHWAFIFILLIYLGGGVYFAKVFPYAFSNWKEKKLLKGMEPRLTYRFA